jgi:SAM-dependent methyltransferase
MKYLWVLVMVAACSQPKPVEKPCPVPPPPQAQVQVQAPPPPQAPKLDESAVKAKSHAFYEAFDRFDNAALDALASPAFVLFRGARFRDLAFTNKDLQTMAEHKLPTRSRTWSDEHVYIGDGSAVFIGHNVLHIPPNGAEPPVDVESYSSLAWTREGDQWKAVYATSERAGIEADREMWNETFRQSYNFKKEPNQLLIDTLKGKKPGTALDIAMGQGRNALYIASQGWATTGVDISDEGLKRAKDEAAKRKLKLDAVQADIEAYDYGKNKWDLVTMIYIKTANDAALLEKIKPSLKKGGLFVLEYFHAESEAAKMGAGGWATGALAKFFGDGFEIVRDDVVEDISDWGMSKRKLVRFVARKK